jgi:ABC-type polysaccharide transport system, permease component
MSNGQAAVTNSTLLRKKNKDTFMRELIRNKYLYLLTLPAILFFIIFSYIPMVGIIIAFQDFNPMKGLFGSKLVGFKNFQFFFSSKDWITVTVNTVYLNVLFIVTGLIFSIAIAIMLSEINNAIYKKVTQSVVILPNFLSWTVVSMFTMAIFTPAGGYANAIIKVLHLPAINFLQNAKVWPTILVILKIWKGAGFGSIVYLAAIMGIDQEVYEAAKIDGCTKWQSIIHITIPMLKSTAILLTILAVGGIFHGDFGMIYAVVGDVPPLYPTTDVIDTFVYRQLRVLGDMGMSSAAALYQSAVGFVIVIVTNAIAKKVDEDSALF